MCVIGTKCNVEGRGAWELLWWHRMSAQRDYAKMNGFAD